MEEVILELRVTLGGSGAGRVIIQARVSRRYLHTSCQESHSKDIVGIGEESYTELVSVSRVTKILLPTPATTQALTWYLLEDGQLENQ